MWPCPSAQWIRSPRMKRLVAITASVSVVLVCASSFPGNRLMAGPQNRGGGIPVPSWAGDYQWAGLPGTYRSSPSPGLPRAAERWPRPSVAGVPFNGVPAPTWQYLPPPGSPYSPAWGWGTVPDWQGPQGPQAQNQDDPANAGDKVRRGRFTSKRKEQTAPNRNKQKEQDEPPVPRPVF